MLFLLIFSFLAGFLLSLILTKIIRRIAFYFKIVDWPEQSLTRKIHQKPTPLLGGLAIFLSFFFVSAGIYFLGFWPQGKVLFKHLIGFFLGGLFLMFGGFLDDKYNLKPYQQIIWPILAALTVVISGIGISYINNPFDKGYLFLSPLMADLFTFLWLMILMYSTKLLDGLDGLVSGITSIGALTITGLCFLTAFFQLDVGLISLILAGASLGFLTQNFHPAKIFLGEEGSLFAGYSLGILAIISGGKIATTFLVLGLVLIDMLLVILKRIFYGLSPFLADRRHFHFQLLSAGFSHRQAVIFFYFLSAIFGLISLFLRTHGKIFVFLILIILASILILGLPKKVDKRKTINIINIL